MNEATKETNAQPKEIDGGSRLGLAQLDGVRRGQAVRPRREQKIRPEKDLTQREWLETMMREARSIESATNDLMNFIGSAPSKVPGREYRFYKDIEGNVWYRTFVLVDGEWVTEEESIFGKKNKKWSR